MLRDGFKSSIRKLKNHSGQDMIFCRSSIEEYFRRWRLEKRDIERYVEGTRDHLRDRLQNLEEFGKPSFRGYVQVFRLSNYYP